LETNGEAADCQTLSTIDMDWVSMIPTDMSMVPMDWMSTLTWVLTLGAHWFTFVKWCFTQSVKHTPNIFAKVVLFCIAVVMLVGVPLGGLYAVTPTPLITFAGYVGGLVCNTVLYCVFNQKRPPKRSRQFWYDTTKPWLLSLMVPLFCACMQHFVAVDGNKPWLSRQLNLTVDSQKWFAQASNDDGVTGNLLLENLHPKDCNPWQEDTLYNIVGRPLGETLGLLTENREVNCAKQTVNLMEWLRTMNTKNAPSKLASMYHNAQVDNPDCLQKSVLEAVLKETGYSATEIVPWNDKAYFTKAGHFCVKKAPSSLAKLQSDAAAFAKMVGDAAASSGQPAPEGTEYTVYSWIGQLVQTLYFLVVTPLQWLDQKITTRRNLESQADATQEAADPKVLEYVRNIHGAATGAQSEGRHNAEFSHVNLRELHFVQVNFMHLMDMYVRLYFQNAQNEIDTAYFKMRYITEIRLEASVCFIDLARENSGNANFIAYLTRKYHLVHDHVALTPLEKKFMQLMVYPWINANLPQDKLIEEVFKDLPDIQTHIVLGCVLTMVCNNIYSADTEDTAEAQLLLMQLVEQIMNLRITN
jgi:hypothetical protein